MKFDKPKWKRRLIKALIKLKRIKFVAFSEEELNNLLSANLPEEFQFPVPGSKGSLVLTRADITMPSHLDHFKVSLLCNLKIETMANPIYKAHIKITGEAYPDYCVEQNIVRLKRAKILDVGLIQDEYAVLKDTQFIMQQIVPNPLKTVIGVTMKTTLNILSNGTYKDVKNYLSIYLDGSKQKVLDYHRPQIEDIVKDLVENGDLEYALDATDMEESLFIELGRDVKVKDGELRFYFHP